MVLWILNMFLMISSYWFLPNRKSDLNCFSQTVMNGEQTPKRFLVLLLRKRPSDSSRNLRRNLNNVLTVLKFALIWTWALFIKERMIFYSSKLILYADLLICVYFDGSISSAETSATKLIRETQLKSQIVFWTIKEQPVSNHSGFFGRSFTLYIYRKSFCVETKLKF